MQRQWSRQELRHVLALGAAYLLAASLAVAFTRFQGGVAMIWIATGILVADLRLRPNYSWVLRCLVCGLASIVVGVSVGLGSVAALPLATVNIGEAVLTARLLNRFQPEAGQVSTPREIGILVLVAGIIVPFLSAFPAALTAHLCVGVPFWTNWISWFTAHALGVLTIMPLAKLTLGGNLGEWARGAQRADWLEAGLLLCVLVGTTSLVFSQNRLPLLFLPFLPLLIAVFRLGRIGAAVGLVVLAGIGSLFTLNGHGPITLVGGGIGPQVQFLQFYLATAFLMSLLPAAELNHRKQLFIHMADSAAFYQVIADRSGDVALVLDIDGSIRFASPSIQRALGFTPQFIIGRKAQDIVLPEDVEGVIASHRQALANPDGTFRQEFRALLASGEPGWFETHTRAAVDEAGRVTGAVYVIREISERKDREKELAQAATTDPLTGLLNRRGFEAVFSAVMANPADQTSPVFIALFDLDHFKRVNDSYGHNTGDDVLKAFAAVLGDSVRDADFIARLGGEEFALLLSGNLADVKAICERIRLRFAETVIFSRDHAHLSVTVSAGLAHIPHGSSLTDAVRLADEALYAAKTSGRNRLSVAA